MKLRILFMGTPDFALFSLKSLYESDNEIIGVITQPDSPKGRGYTLTPPPVKVWALEKGLDVYQPETLRGEEFASFLEKLAPDMIVVTAYGKILPKNVLDYPKYGCINVHGSYLPKYRGAAPMQRAIIDGIAKTGVTIMRMDVGVDTGAMLSRKKIAILENDNFEDIHDKLGLAGAELLVETIELLKENKIKPIKQYNKYSNYAAKIEKSECLIDFSNSAKQVHDLIRGLSPIPLSFTYTPDGRLLKIVSSTLSSVEADGKGAGCVVSTDNGVITVACGDGKCVDIHSVLPEGKRRMPAADFVRGRGISTGDILCNKKK